MMMSGDDHSTKGIQRFEVFTGAGRRREWPPEVKAAIVAESYSGLETASAVARRHGLVSSQLFAWRREMRRQFESERRGLLPDESGQPAFVPAVVEPAQPIAPVPPRIIRRQVAAVAVELEIDGVAVKIGRGADVSVIAAVIEALKVTR